MDADEHGFFEQKVTEATERQGDRQRTAQNYMARWKPWTWMRAWSFSSCLDCFGFSGLRFRLFSAFTLLRRNKKGRSVTGSANCWRNGQGWFEQERTEGTVVIAD